MSNKEDKKPPKKGINPALKYSGMAVQMAALVGLGIWIGGKLDEYMGNEKPYFTLLLSVLFLGAILYSIVRDVSKG